ncbi:hypothetical protein, partial [Indiicoccus explosivorum]|uniref:hypothetical protein n=1 Tax=Indiicoccus explosivorum TaxID=1917864 RepID=UPI0019D3792A
ALFRLCRRYFDSAAPHFDSAALYFDSAARYFDSAAPQQVPGTNCQIIGARHRKKTAKTINFHAIIRKEVDSCRV